MKSTKINNWYYKSITNNINRRISEHNNGLVKKTKFYKPYKLIHVELAESRKDARTLEIYFKSGYGRELIKEIEEYLNIPV